MIFNNLLNFINRSYTFSKKKIRFLYLVSNIYNRKITPSIVGSLNYCPSPNFLDSFIRYDKKKINIENYSFNKIWENKNLREKDYKNLNSFFWLFSLDLKSSKKDTQNIILQWINKNHRYNSKSWEFDIVAKRIIAWTSNSRLTYEDSSIDYKKKFNGIIKKQINHLINEIERSEWVDDKMIGCAAIILIGLSYQDKDEHLKIGLNLLRKLTKFSFDNDGFPKSRSIRQLCFYLKYFILIREWFKESQSEIPEIINENIYYLGQAYAFTWQNNKVDLLFNGNHETNNFDFDHYLKKLGYSFKNQSSELGGYANLNDKKISLIMDIGASPEKKFSSSYQAGALSLEIISNGKKLICNSGYFQNQNHQLNELSKSSAVHSTLILDDRSSCKFKKTKNECSEITFGVKILKKNIVFEKNYWKINASHDGYFKQYGIIHEREIEFYPEQIKFVGHDKLISKKNIKNLKFEIRFHLEPNIKIMKTQDNKSIFIDLDGEGWKFNSNNNNMTIDDGLYFGKKNSFVDNQNIVISGMTNDKNQTIKWEITKL
ncbi:heparinase II/III family protein [Candidatus Pelagibacter sp. Uisw_134_02]|uniref:heparinase II/III domain-containing protein n=1 Tax=Candidatus Pelagibacter sp. Uisw_134_02 TaxID=3230990 RepID=UPI0039ECE7B0